MRNARIGGIDGERVNVVEFFRRYGVHYARTGAFPFCEGCARIVEPYGQHSPDAAKRFDHPNAGPDDDPLDDCIHARRHSRFRALEPSRYDRTQGDRLRERFFETDIAFAYCFGLAKCGRTNLRVEKFLELIKRADRKRIWEYAGLQSWALPAVLLTLADFEGRSRNGTGYDFRFVFRTPRGAGRGAVLDQPARCELLKTFADGTAFAVVGNPMPLARQAMLSAAGDTFWVSPKLLQSLRTAA